MKTIISKLLDLKYILNQIAIDNKQYLEDIKTPNNEIIIIRRGNTINENCCKLLILYAELNNDTTFINHFNNKKLYQNEINKRFTRLSKQLHKLFGETYDVKLLQMV